MTNKYLLCLLTLCLAACAVAPQDTASPRAPTATLPPGPSVVAAPATQTQPVAVDSKLPLIEQLQPGVQLGLQWQMDNDDVYYLEGGEVYEPWWDTSSPMALGPKYPDSLRTVNLRGETSQVLDLQGRPYTWQPQEAAVYLLVPAAEGGGKTVTVGKYSLASVQWLWKTTVDVQAERDEVDLAVAGQSLVLTVAQSVYLLDTDTGQIEWLANLGRCSWPKAWAVGDSLHLWCLNKPSWRLALATGEIRATYTVSPNVTYTDAHFANGLVYTLQTRQTESYSALGEGRFIEAASEENYAIRWSYPITTTGVCQFALFQNDGVYACGSQIVRLNGLTGQPVWQHAVQGADLFTPDRYGQWAFYQADVIYAYGDQIVRLDGATGRAVWQSRVRSATLLSVSVSGDRVLVGTATGFLHVLEVATGQLVWEQDVWATVQLREVYMLPISLTQTSLILAAPERLLALNLQVMAQPPVLPTAVPAATAADVFNAPAAVASVTPALIFTASPLNPATPAPILTSPPNWDGPSPPANWTDWPTALVDFLNAAPDDGARLPELLKIWSRTQTDLDVSVYAADLDGDRQADWVVILNVNNRQGWFGVIRQNARRYEVAWQDNRDYGFPARSVFITDLNADGVNDLVYGWYEASGGCSISSWTIPLSWNGETFVSLDPANLMFMGDFPEVIITAEAQGQQKQIVLYGAETRCEWAGPTYPNTYTYVLRGGHYVLESAVPAPDRPYYVYLLEANEKLLAGDYIGAIARLEESLTATASPEVRADRQMAFAEYQLVLANVLAGNEADAARWATSEHYPEQLFSRVKTEFWQVYQQSRDWRAAAEAARVRARLAGPEAMQPLEAKDELSLEQICPCAQCLQGAVGSRFQLLP